MKRTTMLVLVGCLGMLAVQTAWAHAPRHRVGVTVGTVWSPFWIASPWHYPPPLVVVQPAVPEVPSVYIEQNAGEPVVGDYWYYCSSARAYYPAVKTCPDGWLPVFPLTE